MRSGVGELWSVGEMGVVLMLMLFWVVVVVVVVGEPPSIIFVLDSIVLRAFPKTLK